MLNSPSHDAKSGCKITKKTSTVQKNRQIYGFRNIFFTFHSSLFTLFRIFAVDKRIKLAIQERYDKS